MGGLVHGVLAFGALWLGVACGFTASPGGGSSDADATSEGGTTAEAGIDPMICSMICGDATCCFAVGETASSCGIDCGGCASGCGTCSGGCCTQTCQNCSPSCMGCQCQLDVRNGTGTSSPVCSNNATCDVNCTGTTECYPDCTAGSRCAYDCSGNTAECDVDCTTGSECLLRCQGALGTCQFTSCHGPQQSCPGNIKVCNRPCPV